MQKGSEKTAEQISMPIPAWGGRRGTEITPTDRQPRHRKPLRPAGRAIITVHWQLWEAGRRGSAGDTRDRGGLPQPQARPATIRGDELDSGGFEGSANVSQGPRIWLTRTALKVGERLLSDFCRFRNIGLR